VTLGALASLHRRAGWQQFHTNRRPSRSGGFPACTVCDGTQRTGFAPATLDHFRRLLGPKDRATIGGERDWLCFRCQKWAAMYSRIVL